MIPYFFKKKILAGDINSLNLLVFSIYNVGLWEETASFFSSKFTFVTQKVFPNFFHVYMFKMS